MRLERFQTKRFRTAVVYWIPVLILFLFSNYVPNAFAQTIETLDNEKVMELVTAGFSDAVLIPKIRQSRVMLNASEIALLELKAIGVSDQVIVELLTRAKSSGFLANGPVSDYLVVEYGTEVKVVTREKLSSKNLKVGQKLELEVAEDVQVSGNTLISKGTLVSAVVVDSRKSGMMGRSGRLAISIESTMLTNGEVIRLRAGTSGKDGDNMRSTMALTLLFGAPGLLMKGTNGQVPANSIILARTDETRYVKISPNR